MTNEFHCDYLFSKFKRIMCFAFCFFFHLFIWNRSKERVENDPIRDLSEQNQLVTDSYVALYVAT